MLTNGEKLKACGKETNLTAASKQPTPAKTAAATFGEDMLEQCRQRQDIICCSGIGECDLQGRKRPREGSSVHRMLEQRRQEGVMESAICVRSILLAQRLLFIALVYFKLFVYIGLWVICLYEYLSLFFFFSESNMAWSMVCMYTHLCVCR